MIFLTGLDDHAEPTPLDGPRKPRDIPTIARACGFGAQDYVPDPMDAPLGRLAFLAPDAPEGAAADQGDLPGWPPAWTGAGGAAAMALGLVCDVFAPCDRLPGVTAPDSATAPPLPRDRVEARLGNLRDGRPRLDILYGGACLQGSESVRLRRMLQDPTAPERLQPGQLADLRMAAHPATFAVHNALVDLHNALCRTPGVEDPRALTTALWHRTIRKDALPALCGDDLADGRSMRDFSAAHPDGPGRTLPMEAAFGPFSLLVPMLLAGAAPDAAHRTLHRQVSRAVRHNLPRPADLCAAFGIAASATGADRPLPTYLLAEAIESPHPFGPLGARLLSETVLTLIDAESSAQVDCPDGKSAQAFAILRNLTSQSAKSGM